MPAASVAAKCAMSTPSRDATARMSSASPPTEVASDRGWRAPSDNSTDTVAGTDMKVRV